MQDATHEYFADASINLHRRFKRGLLAYSYRELYEMQIAVNRAMAEIEAADGENDRSTYDREKREDEERDTGIQRDENGVKIAREDNAADDFLNGKL